MKHYVDLFDGEVLTIDRYCAETPDMDGKVMLTTSVIDPIRINIMDSSIQHEFDLTPSMSLFFNCTSKNNSTAVDGVIRRRCSPYARGRLRLRTVRLGQRPLWRLLAIQLQPHALNLGNYKTEGPDHENDRDQVLAMYCVGVMRTRIPATAAKFLKRGLRLPPCCAKYRDW